MLYSSFAAFLALALPTLATAYPRETGSAVATSFDSPFTKHSSSIVSEESVTTLPSQKSLTPLPLPDTPIDAAHNPSLTSSTTSTSPQNESSSQSNVSDDPSCSSCSDLSTQLITSMPLWVQEYIDYQNPYWEMGSGITASSCYKQFSSFFGRWIQSVDTRTLEAPLVTSLVMTTIGPGGITVLSNTGIIFFQQLTYGTYETLQMSLISHQYEGNKDFTASPPCCFHCNFEVGAAQVYHWPTQTPKISTLVNAAGYTFIYPSVYVAFNSVVARDWCGPVGSGITSATTIGFDQSELSIAESYQDNQTTSTFYHPPASEVMFYSEASWADDMICMDLTTTLWMANAEIVTRSIPWTDTVSWILSWDSSAKTDVWISRTITTTPSPWPVTYNPCSPWISFPSRIYTSVLEGSSCNKNIKGLHDPPSHLTAGSEFFPIVTSDPDRGHPTMTNTASTTPALPQAVGTRTQPAETDPGSPSGSTPVTTQGQQPFSRLFPVATIGRTQVTADSASKFLIGTQTLRPGQEITYSKTVMSMPSEGGAIIFDETSTQFLSPSFALGTQVLSAGGPAVTAAGKTYSLLQGGSSLVVDGSTEAVSYIEKSSLMVYMIGSQTLVAGGPAITVSNSEMSLRSDGQSIVIGGSVTEDVSVWLGGSGEASGTSRKVGSSSESKGGRVEGKFWSSWLVVILSILGVADI